MPFEIRLCRDATDLKQIKALQNLNLKGQLSEVEKKTFGFVTASYDLSFLAAMHRKHPAIVAVSGKTLAGYALVCAKEMHGQHPLIDDLFDQLNQMTFKGERLQDVPYVLVGQLCVAAAFRGRGVPQLLYQAFQLHYARAYRYCITDVDVTNLRSLRVHEKAGFKIINELQYGNAAWYVVLWDWNQDTKKTV